MAFMMAENDDALAPPQLARLEETAGFLESSSWEDEDQPQGLDRLEGDLADMGGRLEAVVTAYLMPEEECDILSRTEPRPSLTALTAPTQKAVPGKALPGDILGGMKKLLMSESLSTLDSPCSAGSPRVEQRAKPREARAGSLEQAEWEKQRDSYTYPLHGAVYMNNAVAVRHMLQGDPKGYMHAGPGGINEIDCRGNTPLLLAVKLDLFEVATVLVQHGAALDIKSDGVFHLFDEAIMAGDENLLLEVYGRLQKQEWKRWRSKVPNLLDVLQCMPDFRLEMNWRFGCSSLIAPLVEAMAPSDCYTVWKKGTWIRVDSTISGFTKTFQVIRGHVSLIFTGKDHARPGTLIKLDHGKKKIYNVLRRLEAPTQRELRSACRRYLKEAGSSRTKGMHVDAGSMDTSELVFSKAKRTQKKSNPVPKEWDCQLYECLGTVSYTKFRKRKRNRKLLASISAEEYFDPDKRSDLQEKEGTIKSSHAPFDKAICSTLHSMLPAVAETSTTTNKLKPKQVSSWHKQVKAEMWMGKSYPLSLSQVNTVLEVVSMQDKFIAKLRGVLGTEGMQAAGFPLHVSLPLYLGIYAAVTFNPEQCWLHEHGDWEGLFELPSDYASSNRMKMAEAILAKEEASASAPPPTTEPPA
ncbi:unnamed protein product [Chrysoparadoxa australica]